MTSIAGTIANPEQNRKRLLESLKVSARKEQKVINVRSSSNANQEFMTCSMTIVNATTASGGAGNARLILTGVCTDVKFGESGEVFNAIPSAPPSLVATTKVENPAGPGAKEKKAMPMRVNFQGSVFAVGGVKASTFVKNDGAVQGPGDVPPGTKVVLSGVHTGVFGKTDNPLEGGAMNMSFSDIIVKDLCVDPSKAVERIASAMDTPNFSKWQLFESLPALGELGHIKSQNPPLGALIESKLLEYKKQLADGLRQKVQVHGTSVLDVKCDGKEAAHNLFPDGGETLNARAAILDSIASLVFSDMHGNGKTASVPLVQHAVSPGDGTPPQLMALLTEARAYHAPFFVEPRVKQVDVSGNFVSLLFSLFVASTEKGVGVEDSGSGPFVESSGICGGCNKSLIQLGATFGTQLRDKAVLATDMLPYAAMVMVPRITKVEPNSDQFSFRDMPFTDGFVLDMRSTLAVAGVLVSDEWIKANLLKNGIVQYKLGNSPEEQQKKLQKRDNVTKEIIIAPPPSLDIKVDKYIAISEATTVFESLVDDVPDGLKLEFRVVYPGSVADIKRVEEASDCMSSPAQTVEEGEKAANAWLGEGDQNAKRMKLMAEALVYAVLVDPAAKPFGGTPVVSSSDDEK